MNNYFEKNEQKDKNVKTAIDKTVQGFEKAMAGFSAFTTGFTDATAHLKGISESFQCGQSDLNLGQ